MLSNDKVEGLSSGKLLIVIPCFNEEENLGSVLELIPNEIEGISEISILVIDDGSADRTAEIALSHGCFLITNKKNYGLGFSFQKAVNFFIGKKFDFMVNIDGDGQFNPQEIEKILAPILNKDADLVIGSRFLGQSKISNMAPLKLYGNKVMSFLISKLVNSKYNDVSSGFRAYGKEAIFHLNLHGQFLYSGNVSGLIF